MPLAHQLSRAVDVRDAEQLEIGQFRSELSLLRAYTPSRTTTWIRAETTSAGSNCNSVREGLQVSIANTAVVRGCAPFSEGA